MKCTACNSLMIVDSFIDIDEDAGQLWLSAWRCVHCGQVRDPELIRNLLNPYSLVAGPSDPETSCALSSLVSVSWVPEQTRMVEWITKRAKLSGRFWKKSAGAVPTPVTTG